MMRLLLFGGSGQLGTAIRAQADGRFDIDAPGSAVLDVSHNDDVARYVQQANPNVIVNAAGYTRVDDAESDRDAAFQINAVAPGIMAATAREVGARFVHVSTDYVFDGTGSHPYHPSSPPHPLGVYGASKLAGEQAVAFANPSAITVRTAWVHSGGGTNFVAKAVQLLSKGTSMQVVDDQVGTPTRAANLAHAILTLAAKPEASGLMHFTDAGVASWYDVACCVLETLEQTGRVPAGTLVTPVGSAAFRRPAKRPAVAILDTHDARRILGWTPPHWREGVKASTLELLHA